MTSEGSKRAQLYLCHEAAGSEVMLGHLLFGSRCGTLTLDALPLDEVRPTLAQMMREGVLALMSDDAGADGHRDLAEDEALEVINDDSNWFPPYGEITYWVFATDAGRAIVEQATEALHGGSEPSSTHER
ncbi:MAG TPA: hypothetical protein VHV52_03010 [Gaiellaceae bacterium]|nr:hypothetical protein [Gaiellaceae bacterium]